MKQIKYSRKQKLRITQNGVIVYTTIGQLDKVFGDHRSIAATNCALRDLSEFGGKNISLIYGGHPVNVELLD
jgi:hypothetical protein